MSLYASERDGDDFGFTDWLIEYEANTGGPPINPYQGDVGDPESAELTRAILRRIEDNRP